MNPVQQHLEFKLLMRRLRQFTGIASFDFHGVHVEYFGPLDFETIATHWGNAGDTPPQRLLMAFNGQKERIFRNSFPAHSKDEERRRDAIAMVNAFHEIAGGDGCEAADVTYSYLDGRIAKVSFSTKRRKQKQK